MPAASLPFPISLDWTSLGFGTTLTDCWYRRHVTGHRYAPTGCECRTRVYRSRFYTHIHTFLALNTSVVHGKPDKKTRALCVLWTDVDLRIFFSVLLQKSDLKKQKTNRETHLGSLMSDEFLKSRSDSAVSSRCLGNL